ncbi:MAG TPA: hypothetical protein VEP90_14770 [Methylomirabilota bacterium]|nr:hypothetical protein [Methylomirabilota bacterium]
MTPDMINGIYEAIGGLLILNHCRAVLRDKAVAGVSILSTTIFTTWGIWNLYYYPSLDQWWSFMGGIVIVLANALWVTLLLKYRLNKLSSNVADGQ